MYRPAVVVALLISASSPAIAGDADTVAAQKCIWNGNAFGLESRFCVGQGQSLVCIVDGAVTRWRIEETPKLCPEQPSVLP